MSDGNIKSKPFSSVYAHASGIMVEEATILFYVIAY